MAKIILTYLIALATIFTWQHTALGNNDVDEVPVEENFTNPDEVDIIEVYPNPAIDHIFLKFKDPSAQDAEVEIRSVIGNQMNIKYKVESSDLIKVDLTQIPSGHYYAIITMNKEKILKKFIKRS